MKRIIEGVTYNTDTATLIAESLFEDMDSGTVIESALYQNRSGVYFNVDTTKTAYRDKFGDAKERTAYDWHPVGDAAAARAYTEEYSMTIVRDIEDMPPEATPGEKMATVYLRVTPTLKTSLDEVAIEEKVSGNLWATRCLERCLNHRDGRDLVELAEIGTIAGCFIHGDEGQSRDLCIEALQRIAFLVEPLANKIVGRADAFTEVMGFGDEHQIEDARRRFAPVE